MEIIHILFLFLPFVKGQWNAHDFWNNRYSLGYTSTDKEYGMWSDQTGNGYTVPTTAQSCSGCSCNVLIQDGILESCAGSVSINQYSFPNISSQTFDIGTTSISIKDCGAFEIVDKTFVNLTSLTSLTIESSGITTMPDISKTKITTLSLMYNSIEIKTNYRGTLPSTITHVALTGNKIYWIPNGFLNGANLRSVSLGGNSFINFPVSGFGSIPSLVYFGIENNQLRRISVQHMNNLLESSQLHLNFTNNVLDYIQPLAFTELNLKVLELGGNSFTSITKGVLKNLTQLVHLDLHGNQFQVLNTEALMNLEALIELRLHSQNPAMTTLKFDSMINIGKSMKELFISSNALTHVPHQVFMDNDFPAIERLHLDNNQIVNTTELDENGYGITLLSTFYSKQTQLSTQRPFSTMSNLLYFYLWANSITHITNTDYCELTRLYLLHIYTNSLTETNIDDDAFQCVSTLQILHMGNNQIQYVPSALTTAVKMPSIRILYLVSNKLTFIASGTFTDLTTLRQLYIYDNKIISIEDNSFPANITLMYIYSNKIISIEDNSFPADIRVVALQNNDFRFIHENQFANLSNMYRLNIANNEIDYLPDYVFSGCTVLTQLVMNGNNVKQIKKVHFQDNPLTSQLYIQSNDIGWIEDGALDHISNSWQLYAHANRLYNLPLGGDFQDMDLDYFSLASNRISIIRNGTFNNFRVVNTFGGNLYLQNNRIYKIEGGAFNGVTATYAINLSNNKIKDIQPYAFTNINVQTLDLSGNTAMGVIPSYAFSDISCTTFSLANSGITEFQANALNNFAVTNVNLNDNSIPTLTAAIFGGTSTVTTLNLDNNGINYISSTAFNNLNVNYLYLRQNNLDIFPMALTNVQPTQLYLDQNQVTGFPTGALAGQNNLQVLSMDQNQLSELKSSLFTTATSLRTIDLSNNQIQHIDEGTFTGLNSLTSLDLSQNLLSYFPVLNITSLSTLNLDSNSIETLGGFPEGTSMAVTLTNNALGCECLTAKSLFNVKDAVTGGDCASPAALAGVSFDATPTTGNASYVDVDPALFQCSAENIVGTAVSSTALKIDWSRPPTLYAVFGGNSTSSGSGNSTDPSLGSNVTTWTYKVTCTSTTAATLTKTETVTVTAPSTSHSASVTFTDTDGLLPTNTYDCVIQLEVNSYTSAKSNPVTVYIPQTVSSSSGSTLNVTIYDFSIVNDDFGSHSTLSPSNPYHVVSPTGSWPAISTDPTTDTFSDWFRDASTNIVLNREISLSSGTNNNSYYSDSYFPVDSSGYDAEGQTDCSGVLRNFFFTSAIRTGIQFAGSEKITVGGGEELWVFINKVLVIEIIANRSVNSVVCKKLDLSPAAATGGGIVILEEGIIVGGECTGLYTLTSTVSLDLEIGEPYLFEIFHVERSGCSSQLLLDLENVDLTNEENDLEPMHYKYSVAENLNINGLVGEFSLWDVFTSGPPYSIELYKGNEARHFTFKDDTTTNLNAGTTTAPPTYEYVNVTGTGLQYIACTSTSQTPDPVNSGSETFTVTTSQVLLTLSTELNYEVAQAYHLVFTVIDTNAAKTGSLVVRVAITDINDNCPVMNISTNLYLTTDRPLLQVDPLFVVNATDLDSGVNQQFLFYVSPVLVETPPIEYSESLDIRRQVYNDSSELTVEVAVIDLGTPPHGDAFNVTVNLSNTCLIDELFERTNISFTINTTDDYGQFYLRIPGYWIVDFQCDDLIGVTNGLVRDELITASSSRDILSLPGRARLNLTDADDTVTDFAGGWVAGVNDANQHIQVDMESAYKYTKLYLQGQSDEQNWVTAFKLYYSDDGVTWTVYQDSTGEFIFLGNIDNLSTRVMDLDPPILSQYIRINPQNWTGAIALRMEFAGCTQAEQFHWDYTCERCYTSYYCLGDGVAHMCGRCEGSGTCDRSPTEHSFGAAGECSPCPSGWICSNGYASPCEDYHYVNCTDESCPASCSPCSSGYACRGGQAYICEVGTYSDGNMEFCALCPSGSYQDQQGQSSCKNCEAGYYSSTSKDRCNPCEDGTYSLGDGSSGCVGCQDETECPCLGNQTCFSFGEHKTTCVNTGSGGSKCLDCPPGFIGNGDTCADVDECTVYNPCWDPAACVNTIPGYQCSACPYGYTGSYEDAQARNTSLHLRVFDYATQNQVLSAVQQQQCTDIDECTLGRHICDVNSDCINTIGSYQCGVCNEGYGGVSTHACYSTNYCETGQHTCHSLAICTYLRPYEYRCKCPVGYAGNGERCGVDSDLDGIPDVTLACSDWGCTGDTCVTIPNCGQEDVDTDKMGDDCDDDKDNDGLINSIDNCPFVRSFDQTDTDSDGVGDPCDNCVSTSNSDQADNDQDNVGDVCDTDDDNDGVADTSDNCQFIANAAQTDTDSDGVGDACDNCVSVSNSAQTDTDQNKAGDSCDTVGGTGKDKDGDSILDINDNCQEVANGDQSDIDGDGTGDVCDSDTDGDGVADTTDNCPYRSNPLQTDVDGNKVGDDCSSDSDNDGVNDNNDTCPYNPNIHKTSFTPYFTIDFYPGYGNDSDWWVKAVGREIYQLASTMKPVALIGEQTYGSMTYSGTVFVRSIAGDDNYVGFIFGYVNNRRFYQVAWRPNNYNLDTTTYKGGIKGVHVAVINSNTGPGNTMAEALWLSSDTTNQKTVLWHDQNTTAWSNLTSYKWFLTHKTDLGQIRLKIYDATSLLIDSGDIYDTSITGGRVGVFSFGQEMSLWSDLRVECNERENKALYFNGSTDYVSLTNVGSLDIYHSFTIALWVMIETGFPTTEMPVICTDSKTVCLWIENGVVWGQYINSTVQASTSLTADQWTSVVLIFDDSECDLELYIDGTMSSSTTGISPVDMSTYSSTTDTFLYLGKSNNNYFKGYIDEFFNVAILSSEVDEHIELPLVDQFPTYHQYGKLYFKFDDATGTSSLTNAGLLSMTAAVHGNAEFNESLQDYRRYHLTYPTN